LRWAMMRSASFFRLVGLVLVAWGREMKNAAGLPSDYVNARPHGPFEQLDGGRFSNPSCPAHEDSNKAVDAVTLRV
jgi:hypothetical protein